MPPLAKEVIALSGGCDPAVAANSERIIAELRREETKFGSTLEAGTADTSLLSPALPQPVRHAFGRCWLLLHQNAAVCRHAAVYWMRLHNSILLCSEL